MKKKIISIVCALALVGTMTAALTACDVKGGGGNAEKVKVNANDVCPADDQDLLTTGLYGLPLAIRKGTLRQENKYEQRLKMP